MPRRLTKKAKRSVASTASVAGGRSNATSEPAQDAIALLKGDHRTVEKIFDQFKKSSDENEKKQLAEKACRELIIHTAIEEEIFYPACRQHMDDEDLLNEAQVEHDGAKVLINEILGSSASDIYYHAKVKVLSEAIKHHVKEEEQPIKGLFAKAKAAGVDLDEVGRRLKARKDQLAAAETLERPRPRSLDLRAQANGKRMEENMAQAYTRERDNRGRFASDDDDDRRARSYSRSNRDEDDRRYAFARGTPDRDERGRFMSDDDRRYGYGRAAPDRDERGRFMSDDDDDRRARFYSRSRDDRSYDDDRRYGYYRGMPDRDERGRFLSDDDDRRARFYSRSRDDRDYDDDRRFGRGQGGWYGDPEGHSEAARRGAASRYGSARSRDDDDDDRRGGSDHGGWYGDSEGHSRAAREGWRNRR